jgi:hypothetical protein
MRTDENLSFPHLDQKHRVDAFKANGVLNPIMMQPYFVSLPVPSCTTVRPTADLRIISSNLMHSKAF